MRALALLVLVALTAEAALPPPGRFQRTNRRCVGGRSDRGLPCDSLAWFEFAPASGAGLPSAANLCDTLTAAEKVGNWWCLNGDGTMASGSQRTLSAAGSPTPSTQTDTYCPNGPSCGSRTSIRTSSTGRYEVAAGVTNQPSALTACALVSADALATTQTLISHSDGTNYTFTCATSGAATATCTARNTTPTASATGTVTLTAGAVHLVCGTYATSDGVPRIYLDGTAGTAGTALSPATLNSASVNWVAANTSAGTSPLVGRTLGSFVTDTQLDATAMARIARAVLADAPTGARGEALSETRASVQFCESSDGTGTLLPSNRLCVTRGGTTAAQGSFVQSALRTEEIDNAAWADVGTPTVTANSVVSPGGTLTADTIDDNDGAAFEGRSQSVTVTAAAAYTMSCYAKAGTLAKVRLSLDGTTGDTTTLSSSSWTRVSVTDASTSGVSVSAQVLVGTATTDTGTVYVWGCNVTPGSSVRPYIPATSAAVTTAAEVPYFTLTSAPALLSHEVTVDTPAAFATYAYFASFYSAGANRTEMYVGAASNLECDFIVGGVAYAGLSSGAIPTSTKGVRLSCSYDGTNVVACVNGSCNSTARSFTQFSGATRVYVGAAYTTGFEANPTPVIKGVKADPNGARFR